MARPRIATRVARVGNYAQDVEPTGEAEMDSTLFGQKGTPMTKLERAYVKGTGRKSAVQAVKNARRANKQPPLRED